MNSIDRDHKARLSRHYVTLRDWQIVTLAEGLCVTIERAVNTRLAMDFTEQEKLETEAQLLDALATILSGRATAIRRGKPCRIQNRVVMDEAYFMDRDGSTVGT